MIYFEKSLELANKFHFGQLRKDGTPFIQHPIDVVSLLRQCGIKDDIILSSAILHDAIEDTAIRIEDFIGLDDKILKIVLELTYQPMMYSKPQYLLSFANKSIEALIIKLVDRICNVRDFLRLDEIYAKKYFYIAMDLIDIFDARQNEIDGDVRHKLNLEILELTDHFLKIES